MRGRQSRFVVALTATALLALGQPAAAQHGALVLETPASTEAMAWGNAPYLFSTGSDLLFYAPALIGRANGLSAGLQRLGSEGTLVTLSGTGSVGLGDFAVGLQHLRYGADAIAVEQDRVGEAFLPGEFGVTELAASLGYARSILGVDAGVVVKYLEQAFDEIEDASVAFDLGVATDVGPTMISLTARNLGPRVELPALPCADPCSAAGSVDPTLDLPTNVALGVSLEEFEVGALDMFLTSQVMRRRDGEVIPAGGVEVSYWPVAGYTFRLRAGLQRAVEEERSPFTFGAAFTGDALTIEYAFQSFADLGDTHRLGLSWR